eukprot:1040691-Rhodomonas_salina.1
MTPWPSDLLRQVPQVRDDVKPCKCSVPDLSSESGICSHQLLRSVASGPSFSHAGKGSRLPGNVSDKAGSRYTHVSCTRALTARIYTSGACACTSLTHHTSTRCANASVSGESGRVA